MPTTTYLWRQQASPQERNMSAVNYIQPSTVSFTQIYSYPPPSSSQTGVHVLVETRERIYSWQI